MKAREWWLWSDQSRDGWDWHVSDKSYGAGNHRVHVREVLANQPDTVTISRAELKAILDDTVGSIRIGDQEILDLRGMIHDEIERRLFASTITSDHAQNCGLIACAQCNPTVLKSPGGES